MQDKKEEQASWMWSLLTTDLMSRTELVIDCPGSPLARVFPLIRKKSSTLPSPEGISDIDNTRQEALQLQQEAEASGAQLCLI